MNMHHPPLCGIQVINSQWCPSVFTQLCDECSCFGHERSHLILVHLGPLLQVCTCTWSITSISINTKPVASFNHSRGEHVVYHIELISIWNIICKMTKHLRTDGKCTCTEDSRNQTAKNDTAHFVIFLDILHSFKHLKDIFYCLLTRDCTYLSNMSNNFNGKLNKYIREWLQISRQTQHEKWCARGCLRNREALLGAPITGIVILITFKEKQKNRRIAVHTILTRFLLMAFLAFGRFIPTTTIPERQCYIMLIKDTYLNGEKHDGHHSIQHEHHLWRKLYILHTVVEMYITNRTLFLLFLCFRPTVQNWDFGQFLADSRVPWTVSKPSNYFSLFQLWAPHFPLCIALWENSITSTHNTLKKSNFLAWILYTMLLLHEEHTAVCSTEQGHNSFDSVFKFITSIVLG